MVAAGEIPQLTEALRLKVRSHQLSWMISIRPPASPPGTLTLPGPSLPSQVLALVQPPTLLHGFFGVTACFWTPELVKVDLEAPMGAMPIGLVVTPRISSMSASHIVKDEVTGITYLDTITTSIGRVALSSPDPEACSTGPTIKDVTDQV